MLRNKRDQLWGQSGYAAEGLRNYQRATHALNLYQRAFEGNNLPIRRSELYRQSLHGKSFRAGPEPYMIQPNWHSPYFQYTPRPHTKYQPSPYQTVKRIKAFRAPFTERERPSFIPNYQRISSLSAKGQALQSNRERTQALLQTCRAQTCRVETQPASRAQNPESAPNKVAQLSEIKHDKTFAQKCNKIEEVKQRLRRLKQERVISSEELLGEKEEKEESRPLKVEDQARNLIRYARQFLLEHDSGPEEESPAAKVRTQHLKSNPEFKQAYSRRHRQDSNNSSDYFSKWEEGPRYGQNLVYVQSVRSDSRKRFRKSRRNTRRLSKEREQEQVNSNRQFQNTSRTSVKKKHFTDIFLKQEEDEELYLPISERKNQGLRILLEKELQQSECEPLAKAEANRKDIALQMLRQKINSLSLVDKDSRKSMLRLIEQARN